MDYLTVVLITLTSIALTRLFKSVIGMQTGSAGDEYVTQVSRSVDGINIQHSPFDFARSHHLIMERANIDRMPQSSHQLHANEAWKLRLAEYKADYQTHLAPHAQNDVYSDVNVVPLH